VPGLHLVIKGYAKNVEKFSVGARVQDVTCPFASEAFSIFEGIYGGKHQMKKIQILGTGCARCKKLAEQAELAARELGIPYQLEKVTDIQKIMSFGVMSTPALAVDGKVKVSGRVPSVDEIKVMVNE
jgi:small redox-active disulfide protein 2